jgi:hypothetical protein
MVREMIGIIQLKKYRAMKQRYGAKDDEVALKMQQLEQRASEPTSKTRKSKSCNL